MELLHLEKLLAELMQALRRHDGRVVHQSVENLTSICHDSVFNSDDTIRTIMSSNLMTVSSMKLFSSSFLSVVDDLAIATLHLLQLLVMLGNTDEVFRESKRHEYLLKQRLTIVLGCDTVFSDIARNFQDNFSWHRRLTAIQCFRQICEIVTPIESAKFLRSISTCMDDLFNFVRTNFRQTQTHLSFSDVELVCECLMESLATFRVLCEVGYAPALIRRGIVTIFNSITEFVTLHAPRACTAMLSILLLIISDDDVHSLTRLSIDPASAIGNRVHLQQLGSWITNTVLTDVRFHSQRNVASTALRNMSRLLEPRVFSSGSLDILPPSPAILSPTVLPAHPFPLRTPAHAPAGHLPAPPTVALQPHESPRSSSLSSYASDDAQCDRSTSVIPPAPRPRRVDTARFVSSRPTSSTSAHGSPSSPSKTSGSNLKASVGNSGDQPMLSLSLPPPPPSPSPSPRANLVFGAVPTPPSSVKGEDSSWPWLQRVIAVSLFIPPLCWLA
jgi:hypothetical protein